MIEAAIVTPIFLMLVFGIIEVGLALNDKLAVAHAARAGSRVASASGNDVYADYGILKAIDREISALDRDQIEYIVVYRASRLGEPPTPGCRSGLSSTGVCNVYRVSDLYREKDDFGCKTTSPDLPWCPNSRNVELTRTSGPDYVGVWIKAEHPWVTKMFGSSITLTETSVIRLEPRGRA